MKAPLVHMNGTSKDVLVGQLRDVHTSLREALDALEQAYPNERDYYPLGASVGREARSEWDARISAVMLVKKEIGEILLAVSDGKTETA